MLRRIFKTSGLLFVGCCIGAIAVVIFDFYYMIKSTFWGFNFIDVLSLIVYSVIAIYVAYHLKNRFSEQQMKKNVFLGIANDIEKIFEKELVNIESFMKINPDEDGDKIKIMLTLKKINNKIHILEKNKQDFNKKVVYLVDEIRNDYKEIKQTITDDDFGTRNSFSQDSINEMFRYSCNIILHLDQFKLSIFD